MSKPYASAVARRNGAYIKDPQRENKNEPVPPKGAPKIPDLVRNDKAALNKWKETVRLLSQMQVLSKADISLLETFCVNYSHYVALLARVEELGFAFEDDKGNIRRNPFASDLSRVTDRHVKLLAEMGLTPSSRTKVGKIQKEDEESAYEKWIADGGMGNN